ncbi:MAZ protein, partial [Eolophus roseicapillus]|nr:MAZ protein [Eolophus roseicapilla]
APRKGPKSKAPFVCALCAKEFKNGYNLRRHEATHGGARATTTTTTTTMKVPTMVPITLLGAPPLSQGDGE